MGIHGTILTVLKVATLDVVSRDISFTSISELVRPIEDHEDNRPNQRAGDVLVYNKYIQLKYLGSS